jgi:hypothetical protein
MTDDIYSTEWWRWKMFRLIADYLYSPTELNEAHIRAVLRDYQRFQRDQVTQIDDEHERVMDYY